jgi:hypothetical protein
MKRNLMILGVVLIVLGVAGLVFQGVTYTTREKVADIGGVQITAKKETTVPIPLIAGGVLLVGGIVLIVAASRKA